MARRYGRSVKGQRPICKDPLGHWKTTTFTAALRCSGLTAPMVLDGPTNGEAFLAYTTQVLVPTLIVGDIVNLDNLSSHKVAGVREAIEAWEQASAISLLRVSTSIPSSWLSPRSKLSCDKPRSLATSRRP